MERHTETIRREVAEVHKEGDVDVDQGRRGGQKRGDNDEAGDER